MHVNFDTTHSSPEESNLKLLHLLTPYSLSLLGLRLALRELPITPKKIQTAAEYDLQSVAEGILTAFYITLTGQVDGYEILRIAATKAAGSYVANAAIKIVAEQVSPYSENRGTEYIHAILNSSPVHKESIVGLKADLEAALQDIDIISLPLWPYSIPSWYSERRNAFYSELEEIDKEEGELLLSLANAKPERDKLNAWGMLRFSELMDFRHASKEEPRNNQPFQTRQTSASSALNAVTTEIEAETDLLNRKNLTESLSRLLTEREDTHPFTIGLFGHWGEGKSSQINFLQKKLQNIQQPRVMMAEFNAWENEKAENLAAMLAQSVVDSLVEKKGVVEKVWLALRLAVRRNETPLLSAKKSWFRLVNWMSPALVWLWVALPPIATIGVAFLVLNWLPLPTNLFSINPVILKWLAGVAATIGTVSHFMHSNLTGWFKRVDGKKTLALFSLPDYSDHRGLVVEIHRTLRNLCGLCLSGGDDAKQGDYLLLVVDDLDRCNVDTVKEVLDAVRLVARIPRVVTLVAIDERMAYAAVEKHYHQFGHAGRPPAQVARDYLAKVLQVSVTLPRTDADGIDIYVHEHLFVDVQEQPAQSTGVTDGKSLPQSSATFPVPKKSKNKAEEKLLPPSESAKPPIPETPPPAGALPLSEEPELFKKLARAYEFTNPRLLERLGLAWKLLKPLALTGEYTAKDMAPWMELLFWREWLHQLEFQQRVKMEDCLDTTANTAKPEDMSEAISLTINSLRGQAENARKIKVVDAVLLPSSPMQPEEKPSKS